MHWKTFLAVYLFGGLTFVPLVCVVLLYLHVKLEKLRDIAEDKKHEKYRLARDDIDPDLKAGAMMEPEGVHVAKKGWVTVTKEYYYHHTELQTPPIASETSKQDPGNQPPKELNEDQIPQRSQLRKRDRYYGILKHGNLFLYRDDSRNSDLIHAISLQKSFVTLWPRNPAQEMSDASLFTKRTCVCLLKKGLVSLNEDGNLTFSPSLTTPLTGKEVQSKQPSLNTQNMSSNSYFLYFDNNFDKEDWYFQLINASKVEGSEKEDNPLDPNIAAKAAHLNTRDMLYLIQSINSTEGQLTTKWFNALIGRLFLGLQQTNKLNEILYSKIYKKLTNINKPGFLDDLVVKKVDVGNSAPMITHPELRELSPDGQMKIALNLHYTGNIAVIITTKVGISLGSHFKQREVSVQLSITLKELDGPLIILVKPPPSNRVWYAFEKEPRMELDIEPMVSSSKISYNMVTNMIKSKFAEAIKESLVVPFMDDIVFYETDNDVFRGGIWDKSKFSQELLDMLKSQEHKSNAVDPTTKETREENKDVSNDDQKSDQTDSRHNSESGLISKMGSLKINLINKTTSDSVEGTENITNEEYENEDQLLEEPTIKPKKYIKNSFKKIEKWYKDNINLNEDQEEECPDVVTDRRESVDSTNSENKPQMISNRRVRPKRPEPPFTAAEPGSPTTSTNENASLKSPTINATAMFTNQKNSEIPILGRNSISDGTNVSDGTRQAFIKMPNSTDFAGPLFHESARTYMGANSSVTSPKTRQREFSQ